MPAADVSAGEPSELPASRLSLGLIQHRAGLSPSADVLANPNYAVLSALATLLSGQALRAVPPACALRSWDDTVQGRCFPHWFQRVAGQSALVSTSSREQNSHLSRACPGFLWQGSGQRVWAPEMTSTPSRGAPAWIPRASLFLGCRGHFQASSVLWAAWLPELPCGAGLPCPVIAGWVVCDGLWDGCWQHRSCRLGAWCCARHP